MTKARNLANLLDGNGDVNSANLDNVPASNNASALTTGTIPNARISLDANEIPNLDTAKITTGTLADARIPNLNASKINAGTLADARIPNLNASKINAGTIATARLGTGTASSSTFLRGDSTYATVGGGGKILQVKSVTWKDAFSSTTGGGSFVNITGATLAITPSATSSKILFQAMISTGGETYGVVMKIQRGGSDISGALGTVSGSRVASTAYSSGHSSDGAELQSTYISYLDSPSSTNAQTYTVQGSARYQPAAVPWTINYPYEDTNANYTSHSVSTITLMEVGA